MRRHAYLNASSRFNARSVSSLVTSFSPVTPFRDSSSSYFICVQLHKKWRKQTRFSSSSKKRSELARPRLFYFHLQRFCWFFKIKIYSKLSVPYIILILEKCCICFSDYKKLSIFYNFFLHFSDSKRFSIVWVTQQKNINNNLTKLFTTYSRFCKR